MLFCLLSFIIFSQAGDPKRRKEEENANELLIDELSTTMDDVPSEKILQQIEKTINESLFNEDDVLNEATVTNEIARENAIVDEGHHEFFDNLIDTTLSEATTMAAANLIPSIPTGDGFFLNYIHLFL